MSLKWIPPQLVFGPRGKSSRQDDKRSIRSGGGVGAPVVHIGLDSFLINDGQPVTTVLANFYVDPAATTLTLVNNPGGFFSITGTQLLATSTLLDASVNTAPIDIIVRGTWAQKTTDQTLEVNIVKGPYVFASTSLSGSHSIAHTAIAGAAVGTLSTLPVVGSHVMTYQINAGPTTGNWQIVAGVLQVGVGANAAATYNVSVLTKADGTTVGTTAFSIVVT